MRWAKEGIESSQVSGPIILMCGTTNNRDSVSHKKVEGEDQHSVLSSDFHTDVGACVCQHIIYMSQTQKNTAIPPITKRFEIRAHADCPKTSTFIKYVL